MNFKLQAEKREKMEKLSADYIPAVLYGNGLETQSLKIKKTNFDKVFAAAGESNLISLDYGLGAVSVLVKAIQRNVMKYTISHVDFYQVNMKEKITAEIPLHFIGESKAVRELGGMLMRTINEIQVECLPNDLIDHIDVDISTINTFDEAIQINDLNIPETLKLMRNNPEDVVVNVIEPKVQVEEDPIVAEEPATDDKKEEKIEDKKEDAKK